MSEDAKYSREANRIGATQEQVDFEDFDAMDAKTVASVYGITTGLVLATSMGSLVFFIHQKTRKIIQENR